jgi:hypothetical protein
VDSRLRFALISACPGSFSMFKPIKDGEFGGQTARQRAMLGGKAPNNLLRYSVHWRRIWPPCRPSIRPALTMNRAWCFASRRRPGPHAGPHFAPALSFSAPELDLPSRALMIAASGLSLRVHKRTMFTVSIGVYQNPPG